MAETFRPIRLVTGPSYVYFDKHIITTAEDAAESCSFNNGNEQAIPTPLSITVSSNSVTLQWPKLNDPAGVISSYSVFRSTALPSPSTQAYNGNELLGSTAIPTASPNVTFTDTGLLPNTTYYYTIAPNFLWAHTGGGPSNLGAYGASKDYYISFGQSLTQTVLTPLQPANITATWLVPASVSTSQVFTAILSVTNTGDVATAEQCRPRTGFPLVSSSGT